MPIDRRIITKFTDDTRRLAEELIAVADEAESPRDKALLKSLARSHLCSALSIDLNAEIIERLQENGMLLEAVAMSLDDTLTVETAN